MSKSAASRLRKVILLLSSALERHLKTYTQFWALQYMKDIHVLEQVQQKPRRSLRPGDYDVQKGAEKYELSQVTEEKANKNYYSFCCLSLLQWKAIMKTRLYSSERLTVTGQEATNASYNTENSN